MTIETITTKTNQLSNFAVCCTTPLPISVRHASSTSTTKKKY
jgi:hypothetical protein